MPEKAEGTGRAFDPTVVTSDHASTEDPTIAALRRKVDKLRAHLDGAERALADALRGRKT